ncbi:hypothetical protein EYF80_020981 [Liparis tanakae]|uniref:Uncharacterized protein n=1 Tax=Liparis tanakae TaxID=230148 RepID=A0A4Z2HV06_9TELE|nr:hypothetical protein EYF80_020981 [Liparis tanakae]
MVAADECEAGINGDGRESVDHLIRRLEGSRGDSGGDISSLRSSPDETLRLSDIDVTQSAWDRSSY